MSSSNTREDAPLLAEDGPDDIESNDEDGNDRNVSNLDKARTWFRKVGHWAWNNLMIVALVLLLLGGVIALLVYFAGMLLVICSLS